MEENKKDYVLKNSASGKFRLAKISKLTKIYTKDAGGTKLEFKTLPYEEGINIEKKSSLFDTDDDYYYYVIGTIRPDDRGHTSYEDCAFRTFTNVSTDEFDEVRELIIFADEYLSKLLNDR